VKENGKLRYYEQLQHCPVKKIHLTALVTTSISYEVDAVCMAHVGSMYRYVDYVIIHGNLGSVIILDIFVQQKSDPRLPHEMFVCINTAGVYFVKVKTKVSLK
jgi:hypothetical protein